MSGSKLDVRRALKAKKPATDSRISSSPPPKRKMLSPIPSDHTLSSSTACTCMCDTRTPTTVTAVTKVTTQSSSSWSWTSPEKSSFSQWSDSDGTASGSSFSGCSSTSGSALFHSGRTLPTIPCTSVFSSAQPSSSSTPGCSGMASNRGSFNFLKHPGICHSYLADRCSSQTMCNLLHIANPYYWQYKTSTEEQWNDFCAFSAASIEKSFCDPSIDNYLLNIESVKFDVGFEYDIINDCFHGWKSSVPIFIRRLSTKSSVCEQVDNRFLTQWKWYWNKSPDDWVEYTQGTSSADIEASYLKDLTSMCFSTLEFCYTLSLTRMEQQNNDGRYKTIRKIRRRPKSTAHHVPNSVELKYHLFAEGPPSHWPKEDDNSSSGVRRWVVSQPMYSDLEEKFIQSMATGKDALLKTNVVNIEEIYNLEFFDKYQAKKKSMAKKRGPEKVDERLLYHGTDHSIVSSICAQNFDWRLAGKNATLYGHGSYFAQSAKFSHKYCVPDNRGIYYMFVACVLVGCYTKGNATTKRPPNMPGHAHELYDSCVNDTNNPSIFVIFEREQCYPRYLISYTRGAPIPSSPW